jgi:hypothetical protein
VHLQFDTSAPWPDNGAKEPLSLLAALLLPLTLDAGEPARTYEKKLVLRQNPPPLLVDHSKSATRR